MFVQNKDIRLALEGIAQAVHSKGIQWFQDTLQALMLKHTDRKRGDDVTIEDIDMAVWWIGYQVLVQDVQGHDSARVN